MTLTPDPKPARPSGRASTHGGLRTVLLLGWLVIVAYLVAVGIELVQLMTSHPSVPLGTASVEPLLARMIKRSTKRSASQYFTSEQ